MRSVRTKITVLGLVGTLALAGCARPAEEALRVGDVSVGTSEIEDTVAAILSQVGDQPAPAADVARLRQLAAACTAFAELAGRYAREEGVTTPEPDYADSANRLGLDTDNPLARCYAEARALIAPLIEDTTGRAPTEDEMQAVYDDFVAIVGEGAATYDQIRSELLGWPEYGQALALRDNLIDAAERYGLTVHPRYQPLEYPMFFAGQNEELIVVAVPLGEQGTGAIRPAS